MLSVADLLSRLSEPDRLALLNAVGAGLFNARHAAQCLTEPGPKAATAVELLAYLATAVESLEAARALVRQHA